MRTRLSRWRATLAISVLTVVGTSACVDSESHHIPLTREQLGNSAILKAHSTHADAGPVEMYGTGGGGATSSSSSVATRNHTPRRPATQTAVLLDLLRSTPQSDASLRWLRLSCANGFVGISGAERLDAVIIDIAFYADSARPAVQVRAEVGESSQSVSIPSERLNVGGCDDQIAKDVRTAIGR
jgi:hypothetical protein